jgi:hypothetical protein
MKNICRKKAQGSVPLGRKQKKKLVTAVAYSSPPSAAATFWTLSKDVT